MSLRPGFCRRPAQHVRFVLFSGDFLFCFLPRHWYRWGWRKNKMPSCSRRLQLHWSWSAGIFRWFSCWKACTTCISMPLFCQWASRWRQIQNNPRLPTETNSCQLGYLPPKSWCLCRGIWKGAEVCSKMLGTEYYGANRKEAIPRWRLGRPTAHIPFYKQFPLIANIGQDDILYHQRQEPFQTVLRTLSLHYCISASMTLCISSLNSQQKEPNRKFQRFLILDLFLLVFSFI